MNIFSETNYKLIIKTLVKEISETRPAVNLRFLSEKLPVQYTYLSKCLNDENSHLSEDHVFKTCHVLNLDTRHTEYVMLLRALATATSPERISDIDSKLRRARAENYMRANPIKGSEIEMPPELQYLLDPMTTLVHISLDIESVAANPFQLEQHLGLSHSRLDSILELLARLKLIERSKDLKKVTKVSGNHFFISRDHPLSAVNQRLLQIQSLAQLEKVEKTDKECSTVTFSSDPKVVEQIREEFRIFISKVEQIATKSKPKNLFQLNFEMFKWF